MKVDIRQVGTTDKDNPDRTYYRAIISSNSLDSHHSRMDNSTLENFAREASTGVAVLDSHNHRSVGIGRSVSGEYDAERGTVSSEFYILGGLDLNDQSFRTSDSFKTAIKDGMLNDVSVGFYGHDERCNLCNNSLWSENCRHWPGFDYEVEEDGIKKNVKASTTIINGHLSEFSLVYDGANEDAQIVEKARRMAPNLSTRERQHIEDQYQVDFDKFKNKPEPPAKQRGIVTMNTDERVKQLEADLQVAREARDKAVKDATGFYEMDAKCKLYAKDLEASEERNKDLRVSYERQVQLVEDLEAEVKDLKPRAEGYDGVLKSEREKALSSYTGAFGHKQDSDEYKRTVSILDNAKTVEEIYQYAEIWEEIRKNQIPKGPQLGKEQEEKEEEDSPPSSLPSVKLY